MKNILDKNFLLNESKTFCILPWIHLHTQAEGMALPCCSSGMFATGGLGSSREQNFDELVNSTKMKQIRINMLTESKSEGCDVCYRLEENQGQSPRQGFNQEYEEFFNSVESTLDDGSVPDFKMRFFDIRFKNICNMKCRTCNSTFSSQWELEDKKSNVSWYKPILKNDRKEFFDQVKNQIGYVKKAYFAGGEPLITEEHYLLLEELIRIGRTDVILSYSTNLSTLNYKDKDLFSLWKHFDNKIDLWASIDHVKERAEYIRHGTDWALIESNFKKIKTIDNIDLNISSVLSLFNYTTMDEFYQYIVKNGMYDHLCRPYSIYVATSPENTSPLILPFEYKEKGHESLKRAINFLNSNDFQEGHISALSSANYIISTEDIWDSQKDTFKSEIIRLDKLRNESFAQVFPELAPLMDL